MDAFKCPQCPRRFTLSRHRAWHMQANHGVELPERAQQIAGAYYRAPSQPDGPRLPVTQLADKRLSSNNADGARAGRPRAARDDRSNLAHGAHRGTPATAAPPRAQLGLVEYDDVDHDAAVDAEMADLMSSRTLAAPTTRPQKRRRVLEGDQQTAQEFRYATLSTELRAGFEALRDWARSQPIVVARKRARPGLFNSYRLRALQRFCLTVGGGAGLTAEEQDQLYDLLDTWDRTKPGMVVDAGHGHNLRDVFKTLNAFKNALRDDEDAAVLRAGWRKCELTQNGDTFTAFFRPVLDVIMGLARESNSFKCWSGDDGPAPKTAMRESPLDGDAFRLCEEEVVREHGLDSFVMGTCTATPRRYPSQEVSARRERLVVQPGLSLEHT